MTRGFDVIDAEVGALCGLFGSLREIQLQAVQEFTPVVESILRSGSRDVDLIEHTLDGLFSFCGHEPALLLFRRLCRHYFEIDPAAAKAYVDAYRDHYDPGAPSFMFRHTDKTHDPADGNQLSAVSTRCADQRTEPPAPPPTPPTDPPPAPETGSRPSPRGG
jgi:hypothetical protein